MKTHLNATVLTIVSALFLFSCKSAEDHRRDLQSTQEREITAGIVKKEIRKGMSGAEVAEALGSPNITSLDEDEHETWIYDKVATEASYSESKNALFLIIAGISNRSGAVSTTQRTLTVIIKFDAKGKVESYSYHASKF